MQVLPAMNRQGLRAMNAQARRLSRSLGACGPACTPASHVLDGVSGRTGLGKYSGITAALGVAIKNDDLVRASQRQDDAPPLLRRVSTIAAVVAMAATDRPRAQWYSTIAEITTAQTAETVKLLVRKMPVREEDAIAYSLTVVLLTGAVGEKAGERGDTVLAYQRAMAALDGALESIRRREVSRANAPVKLAGLGRVPSTNKLVFSEIPAAVGIDFDPSSVFFYAAQFANNRDSYDALTTWTTSPPSWIEPAKQGAFKLAAFAVSRLPELSGPVNLQQAFTYYGPLAKDLAANDVSVLGEWAASPPSWRRTNKENTWASALTNLIVGYRKFKGVVVCGEDLRTGEDWIIEPCGLTNSQSNRNAKIELVKAAWTEAFPGRTIDNCGINYYTRLKWCSKETYISVMREKEAAGRPAPTQADLQRTFENTAAGQAAQQLTQAARTGIQIVEAFLSGNISEGLGLVVKVLGEIGKTASQFLCSAINLIFKDDKGQPTPAGQLLCAIITFLVGGFFDRIRGGVAISKAIFDGLGKFFSELMKGNFRDAGKALIDTTNTIVLILLAGDFTTLLGLPMVDQELTTEQRAAGYKSIESLAKELGFDFTVGLIAAGVGFIFGGPTPNNVSAVIAAVGPAVALVLAPVLKNDPRSPESIRTAPLETIKKGIGAIIKIGALVTVNVMTNQDVFVKFATAVERYINRFKRDPGAEVQKLKDSFMKNFGKELDNFKLKMANGKFEEKVAAIKNLVNFIPDILIAIAMDDPDLGAVLREGQKIFELGKKTYEEAKKIWEEAMNAEPNERIRLKEMRAALNKLRAEIDVLCQKYPDDPNCKFPQTVVEKIVPVEKIVEKQVIVEKVVYRDAPVTSSQQQMIMAQPKSNIGLIAGVAGLAAIALVASRSRA